MLRILFESCQSCHPVEKYFLLAPLCLRASIQSRSIGIGFRAQQFPCQFALILGKKNRSSALPQPQFSKSIKTHLFPTTFNQNTTRIVQNHTKTTPLFNTFRQNLFLFAFLRCCQIALNQRTWKLVAGSW